MLVCGALMSALTQAIAVATGRDFLFGIIPAFAPGGSRNLITWESSMLLAVCGSLTALVAGSRSVRGDSSARGWWTLAGVMGLFSLAWMTGLARLLLGDLVSIANVAWVLALAGGLVAAVALVSTRQASSPAVPASVWLALLLFVVSRLPHGQTNASAAVSDLMNRGLEWLGMTLVALACMKTLSHHAPTLAVRVERTGRWPLRIRHTESDVALMVCPATVALWSAAAIVLLSTASLVSAGLASSGGPHGELWYRFLFVDFEGNLPTWSAALLLLSAGLVAALVGAAERARGVGEWWYWVLMATGFVALSADEAASLHELLVVPLRALVGGTPWLRYPLVIPGSMAAAAAVVVFGRFVRRLPTETQRSLVGGGAVFLLGSLVLETIGGWFDPVLYGDNLPYVLLAGAEEACEMIGVTVVLIGLLRYVEHHIGVIDVRIVDDLSHR